MRILALLAALAFSAVASAQVGAVKRFQWGAESWLSQAQDVTIQIIEPTPIYILSVDGALTASPASSFTLGDNVNRETLVTLVNEGAVWPVNVMVLTRPPGVNHSVSPHIFSVNAKVTGAPAVVVPIHFHFEANPILVPQNKLTLHFDNSSWRALGGGGYRDDSYAASIDTEIQITVTYRVGP